MNTLAISTLVFAVFMLAGGYLGYVQARSKASLIAGSAFAALLALATFLIASEDKSTAHYGIILATLLSVTNLVFGLLRYFKTRKLMPAGIIAIMSFALLLLCVLELTR
ncbi:MAG: TMEM14 family protein [Bacteroidia bacterium]|nr:TMEM14 family protein [Bacteroidia bacterium]MDW8302211.1 TMEM14 family protein [Bacteroidia bacterium]